MARKRRLDLHLLTLGLASSRQQAQRLICAGKVRDAHGQRLEKPGLEVPEDALKVEDRFNEMPLIYSAIRINIDNIQEQLGHEFKCEFMSTKMKVEEELLRLVEKNDVPASVRVANCFFSNELWTVLFSLMNSRLMEMKKAPVRLEELSAFIRVVCALSYYGNSLEFMFSHQESKNFPLFTNALSILGKDRFKTLFNALSQGAQAREHRGKEWNSMWKYEDQDVQRFEDAITRHNSKVFI